MCVRPAPHYTSKTSSINVELGQRDGNWFKCTSGAVLQADFNSGRNLAIWDYRACSLDSREAVDVMPPANSKNGVIGSPLNSMNIINGRAEQLSLFDSTKYEDRRENPTFTLTLKTLECKVVLYSETSFNRATQDS